MAFSYLRVSTLRQAEGGVGIDRQGDSFLPFCERHGLSPSTDPLVERGLSAYHGRHRSKGAMGAFIHAAQQGQIPPGAVLVVEDLDRFSREAPSHAEQLLHELWDQGLALGIVRDDVVVDRHRYDHDLGIRLQLLVRRDAAHDYSSKLSGRIADVWERRRLAAAQGRKYKAARPFWCDWDPVAQDFVLNAQAAIPRRMVALSIEGCGMTQIAQQLNAEGHRNTTGKPFSYSWVRRVLADRRLLGEQQWKGDDVPLQGYFPTVISPEDWAACWAAIHHRDQRRGKVGRGDPIRNLFQGVTACSCGGALTFLACRDRHGQRAYGYLRCQQKASGTCTGSRSNWRYDEDHLLRSFMRYRWRAFFDREGDQRQRRKLEQQIATLEAVMAAQRQGAATARETMAKLLTTGQLDPATAQAIAQAAGDADAAVITTAVEIEAVKVQLTQLVHQPSGREMAAQVREEVERFMAADRHDPATRRKFNNWVNTLGVKVVMVDPKMGRLSWEDATGRRDVVLYRDHKGNAVTDQTLEDAARYNIDPAALEDRIRRDQARERKMAAAKVRN